MLAKLFQAFGDALQIFKRNAFACAFSHLNETLADAVVGVPTKIAFSLANMSEFSTNASWTFALLLLARFGALERSAFVGVALSDD